MKRRMFIIISIILLIIDQLSKYLVMSNMSLYQEINIINNFFKLYYIKNDGAAFSILQGQLYIFYLFSFIGLVIVYFFYKSSKTKLSIIATTLLFSGLIGNLIDRIIYQKVIDFLSFTFFNYQFAIFNIADICISLAVGLFILEMILDKVRRNSNV